MKIDAFSSDREAVEAWLKATVDSITADARYASYWFHPDSNGFGIVVSDFVIGNTGEFHLFDDGRIAAHVEHGTIVVDEGCHKVAHFHEFEQRFSDFKNKIMKEDER